MTLKITVPTQYKHCIITPTPTASGFDIIDPATRRWFTVGTQKRAKWWASVHSRLIDEFNSHNTRVPPTPQENHTPRVRA